MSSELQRLRAEVDALRAELARRSQQWPQPVDAAITPAQVGDDRFTSVVGHDAAARHSTATALAESEQRFRTLFEVCPDGIFIADAQGQLSDVNVAGCQLLGCSHEQLLGQAFAHWVAPDQSELLNAELAHLQTGDVAHSEWRFRRRDGTQFPAELTARLLSDRHLQVFVRDITVRRQAENAMQRSEQLLRLFVENSPAAIAIFDRDMRYLLCSRRWIDDYGLDGLPPIGRSHYEIFPEIPQRWIDVHRRCLAGAVESSDEDAFVRADGTTQWLRWIVSPWRRADGAIGGIVILTEDISRRMEAEVALRDSEARYRGLFENSPAAMLLIDPVDGAIFDANPAASRFYGWSREQMRRMDIGRIILLDETRIRAVLDRARGGKESHFVFRHRLADGSVRDVEVFSSPISTSDRQLLFAIVHDITERTRTETALRASEQRFRLAASTGQVWDWSIVDQVTTFPPEHWRSLGLPAPDAKLTVARFEAQLHPDDVERWRRAIRDHLREHVPYEFEFRARTSTGDYRWFQTKGQAVWDEDGRATYMAGTTFDITERKRAEQALQRANRALRTLTECNQILVRETDEARMLQSICRLVVQIGGYRMAWVGAAIDDAARSVRPLAAAGLDVGYVASLRVSWKDDEYGRGPTGTAIREHRPAVARDIATDPRFEKWRDAAVRHGYASSIGLPLMFDDTHCFGALNIYAAEADAFDAEEVGLLTELANDLAHGMRALRDRVARARAEVSLQETAQRLTHLLSASPVIVYSLRLVDGRLMPRDVSGNIERLFGFSVAEALAEGWWFKHLHPDDRDAAAAANERMLAEGRFTNEYRFAHKDGHYLFVRDDQRVIRDAAGMPFEVIGAWTDISQRREAEADLRDSEARLRLALEAAQQGIYDLNVQTGAAKVSAEYASMLGYDPATFTETNASWIARLHPEDQEAVAANFRDYIAGKIPSYRVEFRQRTRSGDWKWILSIGRIVERDAHGAPLRMLGTHTDITERRRAEAALRDSERRYRELFETNPQPMWAYDLDTLRFLAVNDAAVTHYGYSRDEFLAMTIKDIRPPDDVPLRLANVARVQDGLDEAGVWRHRTKDGRIIMVEITSHVLTFDGRRAEVVLASDVTDRLRAEAERLAALERFETLFRSAPEAISISEFESGRFIQVNDALCAMLGYSRDELIGRTSFELGVWSNPQRRPQVLADLRAGRRVMAMPGRARTRSGELRDTQYSAERIDFGGTECLLLMLVDVTENMQAQQQLRAHEQQLLELTQRLMTKEEEERKALAQTLHDRFAQNLAAAKIGLEGALMNVARADDAGANVLSASLRRVVDSLDESITDVRGLLAELRPPLLAEFGLRAALRQEVESRRALSPDVDIVLHSDRAEALSWPLARLAPTTEYGLFMIAREALANAVVHAQAQRIEVEVNIDPAQTVVAVRDDGVGFDVVRLQSPGHLGVTGMRERAALIGASLQIDSRSGRGTVVTIRCAAAGPREDVNR